MNADFSLPQALPAEWRLVLAAYADADRTRRTAASVAPAEVAGAADLPVDAEAERSFIPRLPRIDGLADNVLAPIHGRLVAHDLLKFELIGADCTLGYRLTPLARQALAASA